MSYTRTTWIARVGTALNRFLKTNETSTEVELTNDPTGVTTAGTPFTVDNMNKIEEGIYDAHYPEFTEAATLTNIASGEVGTTLWGKVKKAIATVLTHDGYLNQGVKTTDSPTFATVDTGQGANEIYKLSREDIDFGSGNLDITKTISPMVSYEMRIIFIKGTITGANRRTMSLNLPSDGSYYVGSLSTEAGTSSGVFAGGSTIVAFSTNNDNYIDRTVLVWKV